LDISEKKRHTLVDPVTSRVTLDICLCEGSEQSHIPWKLHILCDGKLIVTPTLFCVSNTRFNYFFSNHFQPRLTLYNVTVFGDSAWASVILTEQYVEEWKFSFKQR